MNYDVNIVVAGAGVVGLTLAALLKRSAQGANIGLTVVDAAPRPVFDANQDVGLRVSAISSGSAEILALTNAWKSIIRERVCAYSDMQVWDSSAAVEGPETLRFSASEFALPQLGFIAENQLLQEALLKALGERQQGVEFSTTIRAVDPVGERFAVTLSDGQKIAADLLVGADGGRSFIRKQSGIVVDGWAYEQAAFVTHLNAEKSHQHTAWQRFLPGGPLALLPLADGRVSVVWSTSPDEAAGAKSLSDGELGDKLTRVSDYVLGRLTPAGPRGSFPLAARYAKQYVLPGLALIGDAAHSVHPLAGQGANLGIADADCLAGVIVSAMAASEDIGDFRVLRRYERARKGANIAMLRFVDGLNRLFGSDSSAITALRTTGMRLFNRSGPLREHAVRVALGINDG